MSWCTDLVIIYADVANQIPTFKITKTNLYVPVVTLSPQDIQDYFEYILKKHGENTDNSSVKIYVNKMKNRITFKIKNGYSLELSTPETIKLLGSTKNKTTKDKNGKNVPYLEITEVVSVH